MKKSEREKMEKVKKLFYFLWIVFYFCSAPFVFAEGLSAGLKKQRVAKEHYLKQKTILASDDIDGHIELGFFCSENELYQEAIFEFKKMLAHPSLSLKSKQNVAKLIETTEENAAITLYNEAIRIWQMDYHFVQAKQMLKDLILTYPNTKVVIQARKSLEKVMAEEALKNELHQVERQLHSAETKNFVIYSPNKALSLSLAQKAERKRTEIIQAFGFSIFPLWEKEKAKIYIFKDWNQFHRYARTQEWAGGWTEQVLSQDPSGHKEIIERTIYTYLNIPGLQERVLPHEITHLIFREFFGFSSNLPTWLDEGMAVWQEDTKHQQVGQIVSAQLLKKQTIPFHLFLRLSHYPQDPALFYAQADSVIQYLVYRFDVKRLIQFIKKLSLHSFLPEALQTVYSEEFLDIEDFEQAWRDWLKQQK